MFSTFDALTGGDYGEATSKANAAPNGSSEALTAAFAPEVVSALEAGGLSASPFGVWFSSSEAPYVASGSVLIPESFNHETNGFWSGSLQDAASLEVLEPVITNWSGELRTDAVLSAEQESRDAWWASSPGQGHNGNDALLGLLDEALMKVGRKEE